MADIDLLKERYNAVLTGGKYEANQADSNAIKLDPSNNDLYSDDLAAYLEYFTSSDPEIANENQVVVDSSSNLLLMKIPEDWQLNPAFDSLPSMQLPKTILKKIERASSGFDGLFLTVNANEVIEQVDVRTPLQVMQVIKVPAEPSPIVVNNKRKRKQEFTTNREDGIEFIDDLVSPPKYTRYSKNKENELDDELFKWTDPLATAFKKKSNSCEDELKRCPGCKKVFKKLPHKCKKMKSSVFVPSPFKDDSFEFADLSFD